MGTVWQAYDEVLGRDVAVKEVILPYGLTDDERDTQYKRTFREARTAARLGHPGVVTVYDVVEEDGRPWIIMELIRARSLDQVIKKDGPLHWRRAAEVGRQMLGALHAAHEAGVLHRDVKPSNVLLAAGDRAVLTDFGIATSVGDTTLTTTGLVMGSPAYIAPERARGRPTGPASDLWSLGVAIYAMVDGKSPFERSEPMASLVAIISDDPAWTAAAGPLWPVIEGLLHKDPDQRMTAHEAGLVLDDIVRNDSARDNQTLRIPVSPQPEQTVPPASDPPADERPGTAGKRPVRLKKLSAKRSSRAEEQPVALAEQAPLTEAPRGEAPRAEAPPVSEPTRPVRDRPSGPPVRTRLVWGVVVLVAIIGLAWAVYALTSSDPRSTAKLPVTTSHSPTASPSPTESPVPAGFTRYSGQGFSTVVPTGWDGPLQHTDTPGILFDGPGSRLILRALPGTSTSALDTMRARKSEALAGKAGFTILSLGPATEFGPDPTGTKAADLVYEWNSNGGKKHVLDRTVVVNGRGYALTLLLPVSSWQQDLARLAPVFEFFKPTP
ncbi:MAG: serine/threonine protein kinase [Streptosporangiaceae bacterium]|jgi:serine/threonine protein kinase|nr:serine/threonine protein kinase [Streptosporangiaceae bacterium]